MFLKNVFLLLLTFPYGLYCQSLTLKECVKMALDRHPDIELSELDLENSAAQINQAKSALLPQINANIFQSGNFGRSIDRFTNSYIDQFYNTSYIGLGFRLPIFTSLKLKNQINAAKLNHDANGQKLSRNKNLITLSVITAYLTVLSNAENISTSRNQYRIDSLNYQRLLGKKSVGLTTRSEELQMLNQMKSDEISISDAILNHKLSLVTLAQLINAPLSTFTTLAPIEPMNDLSLSDDSIENLPEVKELRLRIKAQAETIKAIKANSLPSLLLSGDYGTFFASSNKERSFTQQLNDTRNGSVSLGLSIPLFGGLQNKPLVQGQSVQQKIINANLEKTLLTIQQEKDFANARYSAIKNKYENSKILYELAKENRDVISEQLNAGVITVVEFLIAQNNVEKAANTATQSKYQLILQEMILKFYAQSGFTIE